MIARLIHWSIANRMFSHRDHAAGIISPGRELFRRKANERHRFMRALKRFLFPYAHVLNAEGDVLFNAFLKKLIFGVLENESDSFSDFTHHRLLVGDVDAVDEDLP